MEYASIAAGIILLFIINNGTDAPLGRQYGVGPLFVISCQHIRLSRRTGPCDDYASRRRNHRFFRHSRRGCCDCVLYAYVRTESV